MPVLQCANGHVSADPDDRQCTRCGAPIAMRRGWRQDDVAQLNYAPFTPTARLTLGAMMLVAALVAIAMGVPLTVAVGIALAIIGSALVASGAMAAWRDRR